MRWTASLIEASARSRWLRAWPVLLALVGTGTCGGETDGAGPAPSTNAGSGETAGTTLSTGGAVAKGGAAPSGGTETGGVETGGVVPSGGTQSGGGPTGGAANGGTSSGGSANGGADTPSTGGVETGSGGSSGTGPALFPECETNEDCEISTDCCSCQAVPKGTSLPVCRLACGDSNGCEQQGIFTSAQCTLGRCTLAASCGGGRGVSCTTDPPECPAGQAPTVTR